MATLHGDPPTSRSAPRICCSKYLIMEELRKDTNTLELLTDTWLAATRAKLSRLQARHKVQPLPNLHYPVREFDVESFETQAQYSSSSRRITFTSATLVSEEAEGSAKQSSTEFCCQTTYLDCCCCGRCCSTVGVYMVSRYFLLLLVACAFCKEQPAARFRVHDVGYLLFAVY